MTRLGDIERVGVIGLGVSGVAAAEALLEEGLEVRGTDADGGLVVAERAGRLEELGAQVVIGRHDRSLIDWADLIVTSPGVAPSNPLLLAASRRGLRVWSEIELGWRFCDAQVVAVTGTNGKTTTTMLVAEMLAAGGVTSLAAGNIGRPFVQAARSASQGAVIVCEVSSFQLAYIESFRPRVAIVLNVADDHYDWHGEYGAYLGSKARIAENQRPGDLLIVKASDPGCTRIASGAPASIAVFDPEPPEIVRARGQSATGREVTWVGGVSDARIFVGSKSSSTPLVRVEDIRLRGRHNLDNVLAASIASLELGAEEYSFVRALESFEGLPHRTSLVAEIDGVTYIDDSKATNPHATLSAMDGLDRVVLIAGGRAKGLDLSGLASAKSRLTAAVVMGEAAETLEAIFAGIPVKRASDVEEAARIAGAMAVPGDTVLLSPACSSLDQYSSYAERGERFCKAVLGKAVLG